MWSLLGILGFAGVSISDKIDRDKQAERNGYNQKLRNKSLQCKMFEEYVTYADCITDKEYDEIIEETKREFNNLKHPELLAQMLSFINLRRNKQIDISEDKKYIVPPAFLRMELKYFRMNAYERYLLAKERFQSKSYIWDESYNRYLPYGCPNDMVEREKERKRKNMEFERRHR